MLASMIALAGGEFTMGSERFYPVLLDFPLRERQVGPMQPNLVIPRSTPERPLY